MRQKIHPEGPEFSKLAAGMWRLNEWDLDTNGIISYIEKCLELGITTFDHADIYGNYGNEEMFGLALKERPDLRHKIELATKCNICLTTPNRPEHTIQHYNTTSNHIRKSVDASLQKLNTNYLDLVMIHRPDPLMDASEAADCFMKLIEEGKIRYVGVSNFTPSQFNLLQAKLDVPIVTNQVECSLLHVDPIFDGTFDQVQTQSASPMIWSPFAGGRFFNENAEEVQRVRNVCHQLSEKYDAGLDQIALSWLLKLPSKPILVLGTGKTARLESAVKSNTVDLERQDWFKLLEASRGHGVA